MNSETLQKDILVYLFRDRQAFNKFSPLLEPEHFTNEIYGDLWGIIKTLHQDYREEVTFNALFHTVKEEMEPPRPRFHEDEIEEVTDILHDIRNGHQIMENWTDQKLQNWLVDRMYREMHKKNDLAIREGRHNEVMENQRDLLSSLSTLYQEDEDFFEIMDKIARDRYQQEEEGYISTGLGDVDRLLGGGLKKKEFGLVFGPDNVGKSFLINHIGGYAVTQGYRVLHISNEMTKDEIYSRYAAHFTGIEEKVMGSDHHIESVREIQENLLQNYRGMLKVEYIPPDSKPDTIWSYLEDAKAKENPFDVVLVDYLDQLKPSSRRSDASDWLQLEDLCKEMSALTKPESDFGHDICLVAVTHSDSKAYGKKFADHSKMGRSKVGKGKVVDFSVFMGYDKKEREKGIERIYVSVVKMRKREKGEGIAVYEPDFATGSFQPVLESER